MHSRREPLILTLCALLMVALGGGALSYNWVTTDPFTADDLPTDRVSMEEYEVYAAILNRMNTERLDGLPLASWYAVIMPETYTLADIDYSGTVNLHEFNNPATHWAPPIPELVPSLASFLRQSVCASHDEIENFYRFNRKRYRLEPNLVFSRMPYLFAESERPFVPFAYGIPIGFSRVGFSKTLNTAILGVGTTPYGPHTLLRLIKEDGKWRIRYERSISDPKEPPFFLESGMSELRPRSPWPIPPCPPRSRAAAIDSVFP